MGGGFQASQRGLEFGYMHKVVEWQDIQRLQSTLYLADHLYMDYAGSDLN